jgi:hypothetical protein
VFIYIATKCVKQKLKRVTLSNKSHFENRPLSADDLQNSIIPVGNKEHIEIRPLAMDELPPETLDAFLNHGDFC